MGLKKKRANFRPRRTLWRKDRTCLSLAGATLSKKTSFSRLPKMTVTSALPTRISRRNPRGSNRAPLWRDWRSSGTTIKRSSKSSTLEYFLYITKRRGLLPPIKGRSRRKRRRRLSSRSSICSAPPFLMTMKKLRKIFLWGRRKSNKFKNSMR